MRRTLLAALVVVALAGCTPDPAPVDPGPDLAPAPSGTPSASAEDGDVLFRVTATLLDDAGGTVTLELVGHTPQPSDTVGREDIRDTFIAECTALGGGSVSDVDAMRTPESMARSGSTLMVIDVTSTPSGRTLAGPVDLRLGSPSSSQVATGDAVNADHAGCYATWQLTQTGDVLAITSYETGTPATDPHQWMLGAYGFETAFGSAASFTACAIELTPRAIGAGVQAIEGWSTTESANDYSCRVGYAGE